MNEVEGKMNAFGQELHNVNAKVNAFGQELYQEIEKLRSELYQQLERRAAIQDPSTPACHLSPLAASFQPGDQPQSSPCRSSVALSRPVDSRPIQRPTPYDGRAPWEAYYLQFETAAEINQWGPDEKVKFLITSLTGQALGVLQTLPQEKQRSYPELVAALRARFHDGKTGEYAKITLQERARRAKESLPELAADVESLVRKAYPQGNESMIDTLACDYFVRALTDPEVKQQVKLRAPTTLRQALEFATQIEAAYLTIQKTPTPRHQVRAIASGEESQQPGKTNDWVAQVKRAFHKVLEELTTETQPGRAETYKGQRPVCFNCAKPGHIAKNCRRPRKGENVETASTPTRPEN